MPVIIIYISAVMLFLGVIPLPYGYYTLLRFVTTIVFIWAAYVSYNRGRKKITWLFCLVAILFNPFIIIHLPKELWSVVDVVAGIFLLINKKHVQEFSDENE
jgi:hypothetical protein